ncbi:MAG: cell wall-binding protein [Candidatus Aminicenantes bacterium]|nr:cell wall-binding protein [Candidatus Aminicenantes bacterium]
MENKKFFVTILAVAFCMSLAAVNLSAETWTPIPTTPPLDEHQYGVTYGDSLWVIVGDTVGDGGLVKTSPDGVTWTKQNPGIPQSLNCVTYGSGMFVAVGHFGTIITSPDGITWTRRYPDPETSNNFQCVGYGNGMFVAVGDNGMLYNSSDGIHWAAKDSKVDKRLNGVCYSAFHGLWVAVGYDGAIVTSINGNSWKDYSLSLPYYLFHVVYGVDDNLFVATSKNGLVFISDNGTSWSKRNPGITMEHLYAVTYGNSMYMAVGNFGAMIYSLNGRTWALEVPAPLTTEPLWGVGYDAGANRFVAVGQDIILYSTPDA